VHSKEIRKKDVRYLYWILITSFVLALVLLVANVGYLVSTLPSVDIFSFNVFEMVFVGLIMSQLILFSHEMGHYLVARTFGVRVSSFKIVFYLFFPVYLVEYEGLTLYALRKRCVIILGGIYIHLVYAAIGTLIARIFALENQWIYLFITANLTMIMTSLNLATISDGYFLVTNIIGITNLRYKAYKALNKLFTQRTLPVGNIDRLCMVVFVCFLLFSSINFYFTAVLWGSTILSIPIIYISLGTIALMTYFVLRLFYKITKL